MEVLSFSYDQISQFSKRDVDYQLNPKLFLPFISFLPDAAGLKQAMEQRQLFQPDRPLLIEVIDGQYKHLKLSKKQHIHLENLGKNNCFTITCAHQPTLFTGPAYYIYKIFSTIRLANDLCLQHPDCHFVPVFINGSEDHDFEEVNKTNLFQKKIIWNDNKKGPVGRYTLENFSEVMQTFFEVLGNNEKALTIQHIIKDAFQSGTTYNEFVSTFLHSLFGEYGLIVLQMDDKRLKNAFLPIMEKEISERPSEALIYASQNELAALGYKPQAHSRNVNLFYFTEGGGRERIVFEENRFRVLETDLVWNQDEIIAHLREFPEKFSPNVATRPLYQSFILPDIAFVGGGGEIAYWMERKKQFQHFNVFYPCLIRRNSMFLVNKSTQKTLTKLSLPVKTFLQEEDRIIHDFLQNTDKNHDVLQEEKKVILESWAKLSMHTSKYDITLKAFMESEKTKIVKMLDHIDQKLIKVLKQHEAVKINQIKNVKEKLFPGNGLQERTENIFQFYISEEYSLFEKIFEHSNPLEKDCKFLFL